LPAAQKALARGDIGFLKAEIDELLKLFRINLDPQSPSYRELGQAVLKAFVRALQDTARRQKGEPIDTPPLPAIGTAPTIEPSRNRSSTHFALRTWAMKSNTRCFDGAAEVSRQDTARKTKPHDFDIGSLKP
jgi:hypothetical protein